MERGHKASGSFDSGGEGSSLSQVRDSERGTFCDYCELLLFDASFKSDGT